LKSARNNNRKSERIGRLEFSTFQSILAIAQQVGYDRHGSLTRLFQQYENLTPLAYRHTAKNQSKKLNFGKALFRSFLYNSNNKT
jgi:AraC-like DNA-binding protein